MAQANANEYWSENVKEHFHTPPGTFTQDAEEITNILLKVSDGNATLALRRLLFYMNRAGAAGSATPNSWKRQKSALKS